MPDPKICDAIWLPNECVPPMHGMELPAWANRTFGPLVGAKVLWIRNQGQYRFMTADTRDTIYFPKGHPREGQDRYTWVDRGDGVRYGTLVDGAAETLDFRPDAPQVDAVKVMARLRELGWLNEDGTLKVTEANPDAS